ncbi:hypothetical protein, conserved [Leishmania tarentolae]|uniref:RanBD1 domain-containing protein n=1 Tax=Leishmania tarentolae TaxID=5689 RepID=A0A640KX34_LEITA|nr:hypothetical protein, conserved [Leishmania tarentolae]
MLMYVCTCHVSVCEFSHCLQQLSSFSSRRWVCLSAYLVCHLRDVPLCCGSSRFRTRKTYWSVFFCKLSFWDSCVGYQPHVHICIMSEGPRKRVAGGQLSRDDDGEGRADDEFVTTPQIADESEMANRRVVRVRRPDGAISAANTFAQGPSLFKNVPLGSDKEPPAFKMPFRADDTSKGTAAAFSFAAPASSSSQSSSSFGLPSTNKPSGFSFGGSTGSSATTGSTSKAPITFSFSGLPADDGRTPTEATSRFSFGTTSAPSTAEGKQASGFHFGFASAESPATAVTDEAPEKEPAPATTKVQAKAPVFGAGSFNFGSAVNSFVEARKKMQEDKSQELEADGEGEVKSGDAPKDDADGTSFGSEVVEQSARDVLATAPSKLYLFEKGEGDKPGRWAERGAGEAKLIAEESKAESGAHVHRLLVRGGYALNATLGKKLFTLSKTEAKHLILAVATSEGPHTYLLKFTGPNAEANTTKFSEAIKKVMQEVEKAA